MTSIKDCFEVYGSGFDPDVLTGALGITPTETWPTGDTTRKSGRPYKNDGWSICCDEVESLDLQEVALPILRLLVPVAGVLVECCTTLKLDAMLAFSVFVEDDRMPAISLASDTIGMLNALGAGLDVDMYNLGASEVE
jgi:hypothetical protein